MRDPAKWYASVRETVWAICRVSRGGHAGGAGQKTVPGQALGSRMAGRPEEL